MEKIFQELFKLFESDPCTGSNLPLYIGQNPCTPLQKLFTQTALARLVQLYSKRNCTNKALEYVVKTECIARYTIMLFIQAARPRYPRSYNLHSGLRPSLVFTANTFSNDKPVYLNTVKCYENYTSPLIMSRFSILQNKVRSFTFLILLPLGSLM